MTIFHIVCLEVCNVKVSIVLFVSPLLRCADQVESPFSYYVLSKKIFWVQNSLEARYLLISPVPIIFFL